MNEIEDFLKAGTRAFNALADYYEKQAHPLLPLGSYAGMEATPAAPAKIRKPRASAAPAVVDVDPLMQGTSAPPAPTQRQATAVASVLSETDSLEKAKDLAKKLCEAFPEKQENNRPKGFNLAMGFLAKHKAARTTDLVHAQRLEFIADVEAELVR